MALGQELRAAWLATSWKLGNPTRFMGGSIGTLYKYSVSSSTPCWMGNLEIHRKEKNTETFIEDIKFLLDNGYPQISWPSVVDIHVQLGLDRSTTRCVTGNSTPSHRPLTDPTAEGPTSVRGPQAL